MCPWVQRAHYRDFGVKEQYFAMVLDTSQSESRCLHRQMDRAERGGRKRQVEEIWRMGFEFEQLAGLVEADH
jgi:hypothetical protein